MILVRTTRLNNNNNVAIDVIKIFHGSIKAVKIYLKIFLIFQVSLKIIFPSTNYYIAINKAF